MWPALTIRSDFRRPSFRRGCTGTPARHCRLRSPERSRHAWYYARLAECNDRRHSSLGSWSPLGKVRRGKTAFPRSSHRPCLRVNRHAPSPSIGFRPEEAHRDRRANARIGAWSLVVWPKPPRQQPSAHPTRAAARRPPRARYCGAQGCTHQSPNQQTRPTQRRAGPRTTGVRKKIVSSLLKLISTTG